MSMDGLTKERFLLQATLAPRLTDSRGYVLVMQQVGFEFECIQVAKVWDLRQGAMLT